MMEPPCGTWFFIWFATAAQQSWSELKVLVRRAVSYLERCRMSRQGSLDEFAPMFLPALRGIPRMGRCQHC